jgi:hypothetical protein
VPFDELKIDIGGTQGARHDQSGRATPDNADACGGMCCFGHDYS